MSYWKLKKSRVAGKVPTLNEIDLDTIVLNQADAIAYVVKLLAGGVKMVVPLTGGGVTELQMSGTIIQYKYPGDEDWSDLVDVAAVFPAKATYTDVNTGSDDTKYVTPKSIGYSNIWRKEKNLQLWILDSKSVPFEGNDRFFYERDYTGMKAKFTWDQLLAELSDYFGDLFTLEKATGDEINTGSNDEKYVTPKSIMDSDIMFKLEDDLFPKLANDLEVNKKRILDAKSVQFDSADFSLGGSVYLTFDHNFINYTLTSNATISGISSYGNLYSTVFNIKIIQDLTNEYILNFGSFFHWATVQPNFTGSAGKQGFLRITTFKNFIGTRLGIAEWLGWF